MSCSRHPLLRWAGAPSAVQAGAARGSSNVKHECRLRYDSACHEVIGVGVGHARTPCQESKFSAALLDFILVSIFACRAFVKLAR